MTYRSSEVKRAQVSGNLDAPEGGFDAIMQAIVCKEDIGWRDSARRLLVFSTDAGFHSAGGIVQPNDGQCHLDPSSGVYTESVRQDYPSISQINNKVKENAINIIFAVTEGQMELYNLLAGSIEGSSAGTLSDDSSNVVQLVDDTCRTPGSGRRRLFLLLHVPPPQGDGGAAGSGPEDQELPAAPGRPPHRPLAGRGHCRGRPGCHPHHGARQEGVRQVREGETQGQVGRGTEPDF